MIKNSSKGLTVKNIYPLYLFLIMEPLKESESKNDPKNTAMMYILEDIKDSVEGKILRKLFEANGPVLLKDLRNELSKNNEKPWKINNAINKLKKHKYIEVIDYKGLTKSKYIVLAKRGRELAEKLAKLDKSSNAMES